MRPHGCRLLAGDPGDFLYGVSFEVVQVDGNALLLRELGHSGCARLLDTCCNTACVTSSASARFPVRHSARRSTVSPHRARAPSTSIDAPLSALALFSPFRMMVPLCVELRRLPRACRRKRDGKHVSLVSHNTDECNEVLQRVSKEDSKRMFHVKHCARAHANANLTWGFCACSRTCRRKALPWRGSRIKRIRWRAAAAFPFRAARSGR